jgi:hypothetical protein
VLLAAICELLITYHQRARQIKVAITRAYGRRLENLIDTPDALTIARLAPLQLERCGLSTARAITLSTAARAIAAGQIDLNRQGRARADVAATARDQRHRRLDDQHSLPSTPMATLTRSPPVTTPTESPWHSILTEHPAAKSAKPKVTSCLAPTWAGAESPDGTFSAPLDDNPSRQL